MEQHSKLKVHGKEMMKSQCKTRYVDIGCKRIWRVLTKLRGGTAELRVKTGRWIGLRREERVCKQCTSGEVEDEMHLVLHCEALLEERRKLLNLVDG